MILGMTAFTFIHVVLSLIAILSGVGVVYGLLTANRLGGVTALFLITTAATSITGFLFPFREFTPGIAVGIVSVFALLIAVFARYSRNLAGRWRHTYVITAVLALYLNVFVLIAQAFAKISALKEIAPTESEPPFLIAQIVCLALFIALAVLGTIKFRVMPLGTA